jgi:hypothetical protein
MCVLVLVCVCVCDSMHYVVVGVCRIEMRGRKARENGRGARISGQGVYHEHVICVRDLPALPKQLDQIIKLPVNVPGARGVSELCWRHGGRTAYNGIHACASTHPQTVTGLCTGCTFDSSINISLTCGGRVCVCGCGGAGEACAPKYPIAQQLQLRLC